MPDAGTNPEASSTRGGREKVRLRRLKQSLNDVDPPSTRTIPGPEGFPPIPALPGSVDPPVWGDQYLAQVVHRLMNFAPNLREPGRVSRVQQGPNDMSMGEMMRSDLPIGGFANTSLNGVYGTRDKTIALNPGLGDYGGGFGSPNDEYYQPTLEQTLIHEMAHAAGRDETDAHHAEFLGPLPEAKPKVRRKKTK
jgi:hypothetical protein